MDTASLNITTALVEPVTVLGIDTNCYQVIRWDCFLAMWVVRHRGDTPRAHLNFESAVTAQNDEVSFDTARLHVC